MQKRLKKRIRKALGLSPFDSFENNRRYSQLCGIDFHSPFSNLTVTRTIIVIGGVFLSKETRSNVSYSIQNKCHFRRKM